MALSDSDRDWLTGQFNTVHQRINEETEKRISADREIHSSVHHLREKAAGDSYQTREQIATAIRLHEDSSHDSAKTLGFIATLVAVFSGVYYGLAALVKLMVVKKDI